MACVIDNAKSGTTELKIYEKALAVAGFRVRPRSDHRSNPAGSGRWVGRETSYKSGRGQEAP